MVGEILRHLGYFVPRMAGYGLVMGGLFGALTYPIIGAIFGAPWGLAAGLLLGVIMGIGIPIYNARFASADADEYQSKLSIGAGLVATVVMALPLVFLFAPIAGLTAAYVAHNYAESPLQTGEKRKSGDRFQRKERVFSKLSGDIMQESRWVIALGVVVASLIAMASGITFLSNSIDSFFGIALYAGLGAIYAYVHAAIIAGINGLFINFLNRLYFDPDMPKEKYKTRVVVMVSLLTLWISAVVTFGIGAPFAAIAAGRAAAKYADWYYDEEGTEKLKRGTRLEDGLENDELEADYVRDEALESFKNANSL